MRNRIIIHGLFCCLLILLAACRPTELPPTALPTAAAPPTSAAAESYRPIEADECAALRKDLAATLGVEVRQGSAPFEDYAVGGRGTCCLLQATGTGLDFASDLAVTSNLQFLFEDQGWALDVRYTADGPTGTAFGLRKDNRLALVAVMWTPSADANCPDDQPISSCNLKPEQKLYTITTRVAQK